MIVVYTDYEPVSNMLARFARELIGIAGSRVSLVLAPPDDSTAATIDSSLSNHEGPLFFFGHGKAEPPSIIAQDKTSAISVANGHLIAGRLVYAMCCHSVTVLEQIAQQHGATVLGFTRDLRIPLDSSYESRMQNCVLAGAKALLAGDTVEAAYQKMHDEFAGVARQLLRGSVTEQVIAIKVFDWNAKALQVVGDSTRAL